MDVKLRDGIYQLKGALDESATFAALEAGTGELVLDFAGVTRMNSLGVARFLAFTETWKERKVEYRACPEEVVDAFMMLPSLLGPPENRARLSSFSWSTRCAKGCKRQHALLDTAAFLLDSGLAVECAACRKPAELVEPDDLIEFLRQYASGGPAVEADGAPSTRGFNVAALHTLSVMFIDVAGFSIAAEDTDPASLFSELKAFVATMRRIIRKHGGIVDKVLGDGVLCYFGWRAGSTSPTAWHARAALQCAIELQHEAVAGCIKDSAAGRTLYPIRIGINTAPVFVGDLGDEDKSEFTVIGHGVNYAKRIQDSCDVFMVMMSSSTRDALDDGGKGDGVRRRGINIKHHDRLFDVYELDPFQGDTKLVTQAVRAYQEFYGTKRAEERVPFGTDTPIDVQCDYGRCEIVDVSLNGFQVRLDTYLARDVNIRLTFTAKTSERRNQYLSLIGLANLNCVVRWGRPDGDGYLHGLKILNLSSEQKQIIFSMLSRRTQKAE